MVILYGQIVNNRGACDLRYNSPFSKKHPRVYRINNVKINKEISVVEIGYNKVPNSRKQITTRNVYILHYVINGKGVFCGKAFDNTNGYLVVPKELEIIKADKDEPYETYWIMFQGECAKKILEDCCLPTSNGVFEFKKNNECAELLRSALFDLEVENELEESYIMHSVFYQIISIHINQLKKNHIPAISTADGIKKYIENNYHRQVKFSTLAQLNNYTRNYIYKLFHNKYGVSPQEYLTNIRIEKAKLLLKDRENNFTISDIAYAVGFKDSLYFSKQFRKKTGMPPSEYRKNKLQHLSV